MSPGIFELVFHIIVFLFGVPGNCLILHVFWTKTLKSSTHVFIMALAWADLAVCMFGVHRIYETAASMAGYEPPQFNFIILALEATTIATSVTMTVVIAADRYDCVCRPHRRFFTQKRGKIAAWAAFVFSLVINIPAFIPPAPGPSAPFLVHLKLEFQVICFLCALVMIAFCYGKIYMTIRKHAKVDAKRSTRDCSVSVLAGEWSTRLKDSVYPKVEPNVPAVASVSTNLGKPCSSTAVNASRMAQSEAAPVGENAPDKNTKILDSRPQTIKHALVTKETESRVINGNPSPHHPQGNAGRAPKNADAANLQRKTTRMLFITSVVFLLTWLPYWVYVAATFASYCDPAFEWIITKLSITLYVNNAVNPLIYGLANRRFRKDCKTALSKIKLCLLK